MSSQQNELAKRFTKLHKPGEPIVLTNVWDAVGARAIAKLSGTKALATASYAVAEASGFADDDLTLEDNLHAAGRIAKVAKEFDLPFSVDIRDAYGDRLEEAITSLLKLGVVGINLEDVDQENKRLYSIEENVKRLKRVKKVAADAGVPDFHINARTDALLFGGTADDAIARGRAYLDGGAASVFVWGGGARGGITRQEVEQLCKGLDGRLNVSMRLASGNLTVKDVSKIGVARVSIGPGLQFVALEAMTNAAKNALQR